MLTIAQPFQIWNHSDFSITICKTPFDFCNFSNPLEWFLFYGNRRQSKSKKGHTARLASLHVELMLIMENNFIIRGVEIPPWHQQGLPGTRITHSAWQCVNKVQAENDCTIVWQRKAYALPPFPAFRVRTIFRRKKGTEYQDLLSFMHSWCWRTSVSEAGFSSGDGGWLPS